MDDNIVLIDQIMQQFFDLQRIKNAKDMDKEINYQESILKARMHQLGICTETLEMV